MRRMSTKYSKWTNLSVNIDKCLYRKIFRDMVKNKKHFNLVLLTVFKHFYYILLLTKILENPFRQRSLAGYSPWGLQESDMT